ncbi:immunoglobulin-like domain-containing protein, partial [Extibacter muris]
MNIKKVFCILIALTIMFVPIELVHAEEITIFRVSTSEQFVDAVKQINEGDDNAEYVIEMLNDIEVTTSTSPGANLSLEFKKGTTTIYGNNHSLKGKLHSFGLIWASGNSVVNLGSEDQPEKSKLIIEPASSFRLPELLGISGSATVNVYYGVVFQNNSTIDRPGGAIYVENGTLNMYGGIIRNCTDAYTGWGGAVYSSSKFTMYGGTIENNVVGEKGLEGFGGGVCNLGTFTMKGGVIQNNKAESPNKEGFGGGVCNLGTFIMEGGVIQNNTSSTAADDVFSQNKTKITVAANKDKGFGTLTSTKEQISGWFEDGNNENSNRWDVNNYCVEIAAEDASKETVIALKAAHGAKKEITVTFNTNSGVWTDTTDKFSQNEDSTYSETLNLGEKAIAPTNPTKTAYTFLGWFTQNDTAYDFDSEVNENITLYAKWAKNMEPLNTVPTINASDKTLTVGDKFDPLKDVTASDKEDGDITEKVEVLSNDVDTSKAGTYTVIYKVTDSKGASSTKTITVTVKAKDTQNPTTDDSKKPSATDTDRKPASTDKQTTSNSPKTGDSTNMTTWLALMFVSL